MNYPDSNLEAIRRCLEHFTKEPHPRGEPLDTSLIESLRLGTTVATNALLERKGTDCALITTKGFKDVLAIGNQSRPDIFDLSITRPDKLYKTVVEIDERVTLEDYVEDPLQVYTDPTGKDDLYKGISGETVRVIKRPDSEEIRSALTLIHASGIKSIAICFIHSYTYPEHELLVADLAKEVGFEHVYLSCQSGSMIKYVNRSNSCVVNAYLTPEIQNYLSNFQSGLKHGLKTMKNLQGVQCEFMQSDGGLVSATSFSGLRAILSGPAGGVVGYSKTCYDPSNSIPLIGFDMGGTSTDVSRFDGSFSHVFETTTAGITIQSPQLDINTVAAGGGSILHFTNGLMKVGPQSASSHPGPACYRKGGPLTVTDANLLLGRLVIDFFPCIFGPNENEPLDLQATITKFQELTDEINTQTGNYKSIWEIAHGFLQIACENMARPIRQLTEAKGHVTSKHRLVSFGGAGGQCAIHVAELLGIEQILIPKYSSILSAYGMALADVVEEVQEPCMVTFDSSDTAILDERLTKLQNDAIEKLNKQGFTMDDISIEHFLNMRFQGTESGIMVPSIVGETFLETFYGMHKKEFGFLFENKDVLVDDVRVRASGKSHDQTIDLSTVDSQLDDLDGKLVYPSDDVPKLTKDAHFVVNKSLNLLATSIYKFDDLAIGTKIDGPCIIADGTQTNVIPPNYQAVVLKTHLFVSKIHEAQEVKKSAQTGEVIIEPVLLSIFGHRFMDIAEQMGNSLQKTSVSVNVKERLDFSCALFDLNGNLVANAPHLPVHLGSMSSCVSKQANLWKGKLKPGDVLITNHPMAGGTHLPDITVITPSFDSHGKLIFYVASRAHHADIGGLLPGSMPPNSTELWQEGASIFSEFLVKDGVFQEEMIVEKLFKEPSQYPDCSGTRRLSDNLSDLKAQIAANQRGIDLIDQLVQEFGLKVINAYMKAIQDNAANTVTKMINNLLSKYDNKMLQCIDYMDDGSQIQLKVYPDDRGKVIFDFDGTSMQTYNNFNAPTSITYSAIIYCLRCMVDEDIPLNQGCLRPIEVKIPTSSLLSPDDGCAVVGGNVCTSQRITDVILKTFNVMADSQGCCNNFTFGTDGYKDSDGKYVPGFGYYETIAGGHGAGPTWSGQSGVHTNMTNTRITDVEVFERRYPVIVREFGFRAGSGGQGKFSGGDGVIRDVQFRKDVTASVLSERRVIAPHGMHEGKDGKRGVNLWIRNVNGEERSINIGGRSSVKVKTGERIIIMTPGGGGWGNYNDEQNDTEPDSRTSKKHHLTTAGGSLNNRKRIQLEN